MKNRRFLYAILLGILVTSAIGLSQQAEPKKAEPVERLSAQTRSIRFSHAKHSDTGCATCHTAAMTSQHAQDDLSPNMNACATCHADTAPKLNECAECHVGYPIKVKEVVREQADWKKVSPPPMIAPANQPKLRFNHAKHIGLEEMSCATCHGPNTAEPTYPSMSSCNTCHATTPTAPEANNCTACHVTDPKTNRVKTTFADTTRTLRPNNHDVDWMRRHGHLAKTSSECSSCHMESDCDDCHTDQLAKPFSVHPPNFIAIHGTNARSAMGDCNDCHSTEQFCVTCHAQANVLTTERDRPPVRLKFHPDGWLDASTPNNHGVLARRDIAECASCHQENDCVTCHAGVNPHPVDFAVECKGWLQANPRACLKCHSDLDLLTPRCR